MKREQLVMPLVLIVQRDEWVQLAKLDKNISTVDWPVECCDEKVALPVVGMYEPYVLM